MLRISEIVNHPDESILRLEGKIMGEWVTELQQVAHSYLQKNTKLTLDFQHVDFVDAAGIQALKGLTARGVKIVNCSGFLKQLLQEACHE